MAWTDAARAAALIVRRAHASGVKSAEKRWQAGDKHSVYKQGNMYTMHQLASSLRHARAGAYDKSTAQRLAKAAGAAHVLRKYTGKY